MNTYLHNLVLRLATGFIAASGLSEADALEFPIATTAAIESGIQAAFDGSNYLVAVQGGPLGQGIITAQLISQSGGLVTNISIPAESGGMPELAFDGSNYFLVWAGPGGTPGFNGQFISKTGGLTGEVLRIGSPCSLSPRAVSVAFGAGKYLACWSDNTTVRGQFVTPNGFLEGGSFLISGAVQRARENAIGFDGTHFFVVFNGSGDIRSNIWGQLVSPAGALINGTVPINNSTNPCDNPLAVAFDGTNYFVAFNEEIGGYGGAFHVFGRLVSTSGAVLTNQIIIADGPGFQVFPFLAFDGSSHLLSWSQATGLSNLNLSCRFFNRAGQPLGPEFSPIPAQGTNRPVFGAPLFDGRKYLVTGVLASLTNGFNAASADVYGVFLPPPPRLHVAGPLANGQFPLRLTGASGFDYVIQMTTNLARLTWTSVYTNSPTNGSFNFIDMQATNAGRFYRAVVK